MPSPASRQGEVCQKNKHPKAFALLGEDLEKLDTPTPSKLVAHSSDYYIILHARELLLQLQKATKNTSYNVAACNIGDGSSSQPKRYLVGADGFARPVCQSNGEDPTPDGSLALYEPVEAPDIDTLRRLVQMKCSQADAERCLSVRYQCLAYALGKTAESESVKHKLATLSSRPSSNSDRVEVPSAAPDYLPFVLYVSSGPCSVNPELAATLRYIGPARAITALSTPQSTMVDVGFEGLTWSAVDIKQTSSQTTLDDCIDQALPPPGKVREWYWQPTTEDAVNISRMPLQTEAGGDMAQEFYKKIKSEDFKGKCYVGDPSQSYRPMNSDAAGVEHLNINSNAPGRWQRVYGQPSLAHSAVVDGQLDSACPNLRNLHCFGTRNGKAPRPPPPPPPPPPSATATTPSVSSTQEAFSSAGLAESPPEVNAGGGARSGSSRSPALYGTIESVETPPKQKSFNPGAAFFFGSDGKAYSVPEKNSKGADIPGAFSRLHKPTKAVRNKMVELGSNGLEAGPDGIGPIDGLRVTSFADNSANATNYVMDCSGNKVSGSELNCLSSRAQGGSSLERLQNCVGKSYRAHPDSTVGLSVDSDFCNIAYSDGRPTDDDRFDLINAINRTRRPPASLGNGVQDRTNTGTYLNPPYPLPTDFPTLMTPDVYKVRGMPYSSPAETKIADSLRPSSKRRTTLSSPPTNGKDPLDALIKQITPIVDKASSTLSESISRHRSDMDQLKTMTGHLASETQKQTLKALESQKKQSDYLIRLTNMETSATRTSAMAEDAHLKMLTRSYAYFGWGALALVLAVGVVRSKAT